jgi:hypothetical protein
MVNMPMPQQGDNNLTGYTPTRDRIGYTPTRDGATKGIPML